MDSNIFLTLLDEKFLPFTASRRSAQTHVVLLLDNSSGQVHPDILQTAKDNHVIMVGLPPHITHITRALGVSLMKPRKDYWTAGIEEAVQSMKKPFEKYTEEDVITLLCTYLCTWEEGGWIILEPILQCHDTFQHQVSFQCHRTVAYGLRQGNAMLRMH